VAQAIPEPEAGLPGAAERARPGDRTHKRDPRPVAGRERRHGRVRLVGQKSPNGERNAPIPIQLRGVDAREGEPSRFCEELDRAFRIPLPAGLEEGGKRIPWHVRAVRLDGERGQPREAGDLRAHEVWLRNRARYAALLGLDLRPTPEGLGAPTFVLTGTARASDVPGGAFVIDNRTPWEREEAEGDEPALPVEVVEIDEAPLGPPDRTGPALGSAAKRLSVPCTYASIQPARCRPASTSCRKTPAWDRRSAGTGTSPCRAQS
jgi:hypothetical protein